MNHQDATNILIDNGYIVEINDQSEQLFLEACHKGYTDIVEAYLTLGLSIEIEGGDGLSSKPTPLTRAIEGHQRETLEFLLKQGADPEHADTHDTPLQTAVNHHNREAVDCLLAYGARPNVLSGLNWTPLNRAIHDEDKTLVHRLLSAGANPDFGEQIDLPAMAYALYVKDDIYFLEQILQHSANPDAHLDSETQKTPLMVCAQKGWPDKARLLLAHGADLQGQDRYGWNAYLYAHAENQTEMKAWLLEQGLEAQPTKLPDTLQAVKEGDLAAVKINLEQHGTPVNSQDRFGQSLIFMAAWKNQAAIADYLLAQGADANLTNSGGHWSALTVATKQGHTEMVKRLLAAGARANETGANSLALTYAAEQNNLALVQTLLEAGATIDSQDSHGQTPLIWAAAKGHLDLLHRLIQQGTDLNTVTHKGNSALVVAILNREEAAVKALIAAGADLNPVNKAGQTPLLVVCEQYRLTSRNKECYARLFFQLLEAGADFNLTDALGNGPQMWWSPGPLRYEFVEWLTWKRLKRLAEALNYDANDPETLPSTFYTELARQQTPRTFLEWVIAGQSEVVDRLIQAGFRLDRPEFQHNNPLTYAIKAKDQEMVEVLIRHGAAMNAVGKVGITPLIAVAETGQVELVERLLARGADPNLRSQSDQDRRRQRSTYTGDTTPMIAAAANNHVESMERLDQAGAAIDPFPAWTGPLLQAAHQGATEAVQWLIDHGANLEIKRPERVTPLWQAARKDQTDAALVLLAYGAHPDVQSRDSGETPLILACKKGNEILIKALIKHGADPNLTDALGKTAYDYAEIREIKDLLAQNMAQQVLEKVKSRARRFFAKKPARIADDSLPPLLEAIYDQDEDRVGQLLAAGSAVNVCDYRGDTALMLAVSRDNGPLVKMLLEAGADVQARNKPGDTAWVYVYTYAGEVVKDLIKQAGGQMDVNQQVDLYTRVETFEQAIQAGNLEQVEQMLDQGQIGVNLSFKTRTPLIAAIQARDKAMVQLLLYKGAAVNLPAPTSGVTPLLAGIVEFEPELGILELLLAHGADLYYLYKGGICLYMAVTEQKAEALAILLRHMEVDWSRPVYKVVIQAAIEISNPEIIRLLEEAGAECLTGRLYVDNLPDFSTPTFLSSTKARVSVEFTYHGMKEREIYLHDLQEATLSLDIFNEDEERLPTIPPPTPLTEAQQEAAKRLVQPGETFTLHYTLNIFSPQLPEGPYWISLRNYPSNWLNIFILDETMRSD